MNQLKTLAIIGLIAMTSATATALALGQATTAEASAMYEGRDITPLVNYFAQLVRPVKKPFQLYHWRANPELVNSDGVALQPEAAGHRLVEAEAPGFVAGLYGSDRAFNMYGGGLYLAGDPIVTEDYGKFDPSRWAMLQLQIPVGFQMIDLRLNIPAVNPSEGLKLDQNLTDFSCPVHEFSRNLVTMLFKKNQIEKPCADLIAHVLEVLKVDGFLYRYDSTSFQICQTDTLHGIAVVLTSSRWLNDPGAEANLYTSRTQGNLAERSAIESIFFYHATKGAQTIQTAVSSWFIQRKLIQSKFPQANETLKMRDLSVECEANSQCKIDMRFEYWVGDVSHEYSAQFTSEDVENLLLPSFPKKFAANDRIEHFHWSNLDGQPTTPKTERWIKDHLFECGSKNFLGDVQPWRAP